MSSTIHLYASIINCTNWFHTLNVTKSNAENLTLGRYLFLINFANYEIDNVDK